MSLATTSSSLHPLITQNLVYTKKYFCPFFQRGYCRESSRCNFSHDYLSSIKIPTDYCHFYIANQCLYGIDCKFRHTEPPQTVATSSSPSSSLSFLEHLQNASTNSIHNEQQQPPTSSANQNYSHKEQEQEQDEAPYKSNNPSTLYALMAIAGDMGNISSVTNHHDDGLTFEEANFNQAQYSGDCLGQQQFLICDLCERDCLDPYNLEQQRQHRDECLREHEREMELSFAVQRSRDKVCGICMDTVVEKKPITSSRFGILEKCNHIFCLDCIRKWRGTKQFESRTIRACPECRISSDFVVPSKYWVEDQDDKEKLIHDYKEALRSKPCKYFDEGRGECPFAGSCFYKHAYPDGRIAKLEKPKRRKNRLGYHLADYILWNVWHSTDEDDWSNDDLVSLYLDTDYGYSEDDDDDDDDLEVDYDEVEQDESELAQGEVEVQVIIDDEDDLGEESWADLGGGEEEEDVEGEEEDEEGNEDGQPEEDQNEEQNEDDQDEDEDETLADDAIIIRAGLFM